MFIKKYLSFINHLKEDKYAMFRYIAHVQTDGHSSLETTDNMDRFANIVNLSQMFKLMAILVKKLLITIFTNPSIRAGYDTRSIFKQSLAGLNSEFSFS